MEMYNGKKTNYECYEPGLGRRYCKCKDDFYLDPYDPDSPNIYCKRRKDIPSLGPCERKHGDYCLTKDVPDPNLPPKCFMGECADNVKDKSGKDISANLRCGDKFCKCNQGYVLDPDTSGCVKGPPCDRKHGMSCATKSNICEARHCADILKKDGKDVTSNLRCTYFNGTSQMPCTSTETARGVGACHCNCKKGYKYNSSWGGCEKKS